MEKVSSLPLHILVVDDEPLILDLMQDVLAHHGFKVTTASTLAAAREQVLRKKFNLIISDVLMDDDKVAKPWTYATSAQIPPVVFMTGYMPLPAVANVKHVLIKPFSVEALMKVVFDELGCADSCL